MKHLKFSSFSPSAHTYRHITFYYFSFTVRYFDYKNERFHFIFIYSCQNVLVFFLFFYRLLSVTVRFVHPVIFFLALVLHLVLWMQNVLIGRKKWWIKKENICFCCYTNSTICLVNINKYTVRSLYFHRLKTKRTTTKNGEKKKISECRTPQAITFIHLNVHQCFSRSICNHQTDENRRKKRSTKQEKRKRRQNIIFYI